jgi:hypothetical protein
MKTAAGLSGPAMPITWSTTSASRGSARWRAGAGGWRASLRGAPNPRPARRATSRTAPSSSDIAEEARIFQARQRGLSGLGGRDRAFDSPQPTIFQLYSSRATVPLAARGTGIASRPTARASGIEAFRPAADSGIRRSRTRWWTADNYPLHAITQRPMAHVPFLGQPERVAQADPRRRTRSICRRSDLGSAGLDDGDWAGSPRHLGAGRARCGTWRR